MWERLAGYLAVALAKTLAEEALRESSTGCARCSEPKSRQRDLSARAAAGWPSDLRLHEHGIERLVGLPAERVMADADSFRQGIADEDRGRTSPRPRIGLPAT